MKRAASPIRNSALHLGRQTSLELSGQDQYSSKTPLSLVMPMKAGSAMPVDEADIPPNLFSSLRAAHMTKIHLKISSTIALMTTQTTAQTRTPKPAQDGNV